MQQNGNALAAYVGDLTGYLAAQSTLEYYREPLPGPVDARLDEAVARYTAYSAAERATFRGLLPHSAKALFGIYGHRAATRAVNTADPGLLQQGLIASTIANDDVPASRRIEIGLAVYHHCARKLGLNPADFFVIAADYANEDLAPFLVAFGNKQDVTLKKYGWQEQTTADGVQYKYGWK